MTQGWKKTLSIMLCAAMIASGSVLAFAEGQTDEEQTPSVTGEELDGGYQVSEAVVAAAGALEALPELDSLNDQTDADALLVQVQAARAAVEALTEEEKTALSTDAADLLNKLDELEFFFANRPVTAPEDAAVSFLNAEPAQTTLKGTGSATDPYLVGNEDELKEAVAQGGHIKLTDNIELSAMIDINKPTNLLMGEHSITRNVGTAISVRSVVVLNGGKISAPLNGVALQESQNQTEVKLTVDGTEISATQNQHAILIKSGEVIINNGTLNGASAGIAAMGKNVKVTVNNGTIHGDTYGVAGNGTKDSYDGTNIVINGGTVTGGFHAVFHPQDGSLTIKGGYLEGRTGVEMRAGNLYVSGGTIVGTDSTTTVIENASGSTTLGAGIAVAQHTTQLPINVQISGGTIQAATALKESNPQKNSQESIQKVSISVIGGNFESPEGNSAIASENVENFVKGGRFSSKIGKSILDVNILAELYSEQLNPDAPYSYYQTVSDAKDVATTVGGSVTDLKTGVVENIQPSTPSTPSTPSAPSAPSTGASSTVQQMEEREKPDPANEKMTEAYNFWQQVKARIRSAKDGKMLKITVNKNAEYMPASVMQTLFEREDVGLTLYWNGKTIVIPAGKAMPKQPMKVYWTVKTLLELYA